MERNEMSRQIQEMEKTEGALAEQLDIHQTNFDALKGELNEVFGGI